MMAHRTEQEAIRRARQAMATAIDYLDALLYHTKDAGATQAGVDSALLQALAALEGLYHLRMQRGQA